MPVIDSYQSASEFAGKTMHMQALIASSTPKASPPPAPVQDRGPALPPRWLWVTLLLTAALASGLGLYWPEVYRDSAQIKAAWLVNDLVTLLVVLPLGIAAWRRGRRGELSAQLLVHGLLLYLFYNYAFYLFGAAFNKLFLTYVALVTGSGSALVISWARLDWRQLQARANQLRHTRWVSAFLFFIALPLIVVEGGTVLQFMLYDRLPEAPSVIFALDLAIVVPASLAGGLLLWQRQALGYGLAVLMSVKSLTYGLVLVGMTIYASLTLGIPWDTLLPFYFLVLFLGVVSTYYLLSTKPYRRWDGQRYLPALTVALLLFVGSTALYGGINLMIDPSGARLQMPVHLLNSVFSSYYVPGLILATVLGIGNLAVAALMALRVDYDHWYVLIMGLLLLGWIAIQVIIVQMFVPIQALYVLLGLVLCRLGLVLKSGA